MHDMEAFIEAAVRAVAASGLPVQEKRNLIHSLLLLESRGGGFTNTRTLRQLVECAYTFLFDKEEMWDYAENRRYYDIDLPRKASFGQGGIYPYHDFGGAFPQADGKLCVDSGSAAWARMVQAGKITGEGAQPVERLHHLDVLRKSKYLITRQTGRMESPVRQGLIAAFFTADAGREVDQATSEDTVCELLDLTPEQYRAKDFNARDEKSADVYPAPAKVYYFAGKLMPFALDEERWEDGSWVFRGYRSGEVYPLTLWGTQPFPCELRILPEGVPVRVNPFADGDEKVIWLARARDVLADIAAFHREIDSMIAPAFSRNSSPVLAKCLDWDKIRANLNALRALRADTSLALGDVLLGIEEVFYNMASVFGSARIPDSVLSERSPCTVLFCKLKVMADSYAELGAKPEIAELTGPLFLSTLRRLNTLLENVLTRHKKIVRSRGLRAAPYEIAEINAWKAELEKLEQSPGKDTNGRRAQLMDRLWRCDMLFLDERGTYASKLACFYTQAGQMIEYKRKPLWEAAARIPELGGAVSALERQLEHINSLSQEDVLWRSGALLGSTIISADWIPARAKAWAYLDQDGSARTRAQVLLHARGGENTLLLRWEGKELSATAGPGVYSQKMEDEEGCSLSPPVEGTTP